MSTVIMNASYEDQEVRVYGKWFSFKPGQMKVMDDNFGYFLAAQRAYMSFVSLPEDFTDPSYALTDEGKEIITEMKAKGIINYLEHWTGIARNNTESLSQDLKLKNIMTDPLLHASAGEKKAIRLLAEYKNKQADVAAVEAKELRELAKELDLDKGI